MRAFVGLPIECPPTVRTLLAELDGVDADLKVVDPKNLHVTLKFLGDIPDEKAPVILERLQRAGFPTRFQVQLRNVGAFPDWKKLNIVWIGVSDPGSELGRCFALNERVFADLGFAGEERGFSPHLTIARKRSDRGKDRAKALLNAHREQVFAEVTLPGPRLYKSTLTPSGPVYESLGGAA